MSIKDPSVEGIGVLTFMRSTSNDASKCGCCEGDHVFCRYFKGLPDFNDLTEELRHRNDLEGREFRITVELLPVAEEIWVGHSHKDIHSRCTVCDAPWGVAYSCRVIT